MSKVGDSIIGARIAGERAAARVRRDGGSEARMPLAGHLRELRARLIKAMLGMAAGMVVGFVFFNRVWAFIVGPYCRTRIGGKAACDGQFGHTLIVSGVFDGFFLHIKVAIIVGLILSSPVWLYQLWAFVAPGLYAKEKRYTYGFVFSAVPLFALGAVFAYYAMGRALTFLVSMVPGNTAALFTVDTYLGYVLAMLLIFGLAFEMPLVLVILNFAGVLTHQRFRRWRRMMIFAVFAFAAVAAPSPDPITMLLLAVPCAFFVEVAEVVIWANDRRRARRPDPYAGLSPDEPAPLDLTGSDAT